MAVTIRRTYGAGIHPFHAFLLASMVPLFLGALLSDWAYHASYTVQWLNFGAWLNAGGMVFAGTTLVWALVELIRANRQRNQLILYFVLLLATFIFGLIGAFAHAKDAWAAMPEALIWSIIVFILAAAAAWVGFSTLRTGAAK